MFAFALGALSVVFGLHLYFWGRLVRAVAWPPPWHVGLSALLVGLALSIPLTFFVARRFPDGWVSALVWPGWVWLGLSFLLLVSLLSVDLLQFVATAVMPPLSPDRRRFVWRVLAGGASLVAAGVGLSSIRHALGRIAVKKVSVSLSRLPENMHGTTVVQLSDVHVGSLIGREFLENVVRTVNSLSPDVVVITGDLVDGSVDKLAAAVAPLADIKSRYGVFFVTGNHDYYSGADAWCEHLQTLGVRVLRNQRVSIGDERGSFDLAGIEDFSAPRFGNKVDLEAALDGRDASRELVLLAHQPRALSLAAPAGVGLLLSGHTHGGQIWPFNFLVKLQQPVVAGLARLERTLVYVSRGTGFWGPPMRFRAPAEVTQLVLRRQRSELA